MPSRALKLQLVSEDRSHSEKIAIELPEDVWSRLKEFQFEANQVRGTRFCQERMGSSVSLRFDVQGGVSSRSTRDIDQEALSHVLMKLRPIVLQDEKTFFFSILRQCSRYCSHRLLRQHLSESRKIWNLERMSQLSFMNIGGSIPTEPEHIFQWLNAYVYHRDPRKKKLSDERLGIFAEKEYGTSAVTFALVDLIAAVLHLGDFIETLEVSDNYAKDIVFPSEWILEKYLQGKERQ